MTAEAVSTIRNIYPATKRQDRDFDPSSTPCWQVSEGEVRAFCSGCDNLRPNNVCRLVGESRQGVATILGHCLWAAEDGTRGIMYRTGFQKGRVRKPMRFMKGGAS
jgi:hypothetical protein